MNKQRIESIDDAIRDAKFTFTDFISYLKKMTPHYYTTNRGSRIEWTTSHYRQIISALSVDYYRWDECGELHHRICLNIDWTSLGIKAYKYDYDKRLDLVSQSALLTNGFKEVPRMYSEIDDVNVTAYAFSRILNNELIETGWSTVCGGKAAVPVLNGDTWFRKAFSVLEPTIRSIDAVLNAKKNSIILNIVNGFCGEVEND